MPHADERPVVLALGASIVRGTSSFNWVHALARQYPELRFINTGCDGAMAVSVDRRLDGVLALHPRPWGAILFAGSNDVLATHSALWRRLETLHNRLPPGTTPSLALYTGAIDSILQKLDRAAPACRVAVLSLPPLGEDLGSELNAKVQQYNAALRGTVAHAAGPKQAALTHPPLFLDLNSEMEAFLRRRPGHCSGGVAGTVSSWLQRWRVGSPWGEALGFNPVFILSLALVARFMHSVLRLPWSAASRLFGLRLLTDYIHLNEVAGGMVTRLLRTEFLDPALALDDLKSQ